MLPFKRHGDEVMKQGCKLTEKEKFCKINGVNVYTQGISVKIDRGVSFVTLTIPVCDNEGLEIDLEKIEGEITQGEKS